MKRKKWTEAEEETLISSYSEMLSSGSGISQLRTREKKFQPIADRVNLLYHLRDPNAFPFRWSWRDVSIKIQNMRHQYLGVKLKLSCYSSAAEAPDWEHALHLWPNFLRYKDVFGDIDPSRFPSSSPPASDDLSAASEDGKVNDLGERVVEFGELLLDREENRRERDCIDREKRQRRLGEMQALQAVAILSEEEERRERWRRWEERREEEDMEWRERVLVMQMDHEKLVMQMHAESCQAQMQMIGILARLFCQFLSPTGAGAGGSDGGINGLHNFMMQNLQQQQQQQHSPGSMVGDNGKNDGPSGEDYL